MTRSRKELDTDRAPDWRPLEEPPARGDGRVFRIAEPQRQVVARCLKFIDQARRALEAQQNADNREIIRELKASADRIFDLMNDLEEIES